MWLYQKHSAWRTSQWDPPRCTAASNVLKFDVQPSHYETISWTEFQGNRCLWDTALMGGISSQTETWSEMPLGGNSDGGGAFQTATPAIFSVQHCSQFLQRHLNAVLLHSQLPIVAGIATYCNKSTVYQLGQFDINIWYYSTWHNMRNLAFHSLLRWKMIILPILTTSVLIFLLRRLGECTFWT